MQNTSIEDYFKYATFGIAMGITLRLGGLADFERIHTLFLLQNIPLLGVFAASIGLSMLGFMTLFRKQDLPR